MGHVQEDGCFGVKIYMHHATLYRQVTGLKMMFSVSPPVQSTTLSSSPVIVDGLFWVDKLRTLMCITGTKQAIPCNTAMDKSSAKVMDAALSDTNDRLASWGDLLNRHLAGKSLTVL